MGFKNIALPNISKPIIIGTVKGSGVSGKNNHGLWGFDADGSMRQLFRNGDECGDVAAKNFTMLTYGVGVMNTSRTSNATGGTTAILYTGLP